MPWNSTYPDGSKSVKQNEAPGQENTTYLETIGDVDHYFDIGSNEDGHHRQVQMVEKASDLTLDTGMDGGFYLKQVAGRVEGFYRNADAIYQFTPSFKSGTVNIPTGSSFTTVTSVPDETYGNIYMWQASGQGNNGAWGFFKANAGNIQTYTALTYFGNSTTAATNLIFANGDQSTGSQLNIRVKLSNATTASFEYRVMYWSQ